MSDSLGFIEAVNKAIEEQIVPKLFTAKELADMKLPHHETSDHYTFSNGITSDPAFAPFYNVQPQLCVEDTRVPDAQIDAAPKKIYVTFKGKVHEVPLRVYRFNTDSAKKFTGMLEFTYISRAAIAELAKGVKKEFNLVSGTDYEIGYGVGGWAAKDVPEAYYLIQTWSKAAQKQDKAICKFVEEQLKVVTPGRPSKVSTSGGAIIAG